MEVVENQSLTRFEFFSVASTEKLPEEHFAVETLMWWTFRKIHAFNVTSSDPPCFVHLLDMGKQLSMSE
jgi:hypothetical protein